MDDLQIKLCDIQGRLFSLSSDMNLSSATFIRVFMRSDTAKHLDSRYNSAQWMGEECLLDEICSDHADALNVQGETYPKDILYWIGYLYRYWHFYTGEDSAKIICQAPVETMRRNYMMFHTMDPAVAIEDLKEIHIQKQ